AVLRVDAVLRLQVLEEGLDVSHAAGEGRRVAALARRMAVAARVPGIELEVREAELADQMGEPPAMLVAAMEQQDRATGRQHGGWPAAIEQRLAVVRGEVTLLDDAGRGHRISDVGGGRQRSG